MTPRLTKGHPNGWPVYLDFGAVDWPDPWAEAVISYVWGLTANAGVNLSVTTIVPPLMPNFYTAVLFRPTRALPYDTGLGGTMMREVYRCDRIEQGSVCECGTVGDAKLDATTAAHEVIHSVSSQSYPGWVGHEPGSNSLMDSPADYMGSLSRDRVKHCNAVVKDLLAGWRCGYRHHTDGQIVFERFNIKTGAV